MIQDRQAGVRYVDAERQRLAGMWCTIPIEAANDVALAILRTAIVSASVSRVVGQCHSMASSTISSALAELRGEKGA